MAEARGFATPSGKRRSDVGGTRDAVSLEARAAEAPDNFPSAGRYSVEVHVEPACQLEPSTKRSAILRSI